MSLFPVSMRLYREVPTMRSNYESTPSLAPTA